jgi:hypothetical protein
MYPSALRGYIGVLCKVQDYTSYIAKIIILWAEGSKVSLLCFLIPLYRRSKPEAVGAEDDGY